MLNFPNSPSIDQIHESGTKQWQWNGSAWISLDLTEPSAPVFEFETGDIVESTAATYTAPDWLPCDGSFNTPTTKRRALYQRPDSSHINL